MNEKDELKRSICMWCKGECGTLVRVKNGRLIKIEPDPKFPARIYPPAKSCLRRLSAKEFIYHPDRVRYPLKRVGERGEGRWEKITWEQTLDEIAERLALLKDRYGPETLCTAIGTYRTCLEYWSRFMNLFGSPNNMGQSQICFGPRSVMANTLCGMFPHYSVSPASKCVVLLGIEPQVSRPVTNYFIRKAITAGAKIIVIDPRKTSSASKADLWLQLRHGTDVALLMAMINTIISEGLYDKEFVDRWCHGFEKTAKRAEEYPPEKAELITGVPATRIKEAARIYASNRPGCFVEGMGVEQQQNNAQILHARWILTALTGNIDIDGGDVLFGPSSKFITEREIELADKLPPEQRKKQIGSDRFKLYCWPGHEFITGNIVKAWHKPGGSFMEECKAHAPSVYRAITSGKPYPVRAFICMASNPMVAQANTRLVYQAMKSSNLELSVVVDHFRTPTAELADYVLPSACWAERPTMSSFMGYGNYLVAGEAALPLYMQGEYDYRTDYDFWRGLGLRLGQAGILAVEKPGRGI